uniref:Uncharacterized protein n=1 Tax=viral metagenome TaxID=1070528 RepID=A0A6M3L448_9ZZZZ
METEWIKGDTPFAFMFSPFHWGLGITGGWLDGEAGIEVAIGPFAFAITFYVQD